MNWCILCIFLHLKNDLLCIVRTFHEFHDNVAFPAIYAHFWQNRTYCKFRVIISYKNPKYRVDPKKRYRWGLVLMSIPNGIEIKTKLVLFKLSREVRHSPTGKSEGHEIQALGPSPIHLHFRVSLHMPWTLLTTFTTTTSCFPHSFQETVSNPCLGFVHRTSITSGKGEGSVHSPLCLL